MGDNGTSSTGADNDEVVCLTGYLGWTSQNGTMDGTSEEKNSEEVVEHVGFYQQLRERRQGMVVYWRFGVASSVLLSIFQVMLGV